MEVVSGANVITVAVALGAMSVNLAVINGGICVVCIMREAAATDTIATSITLISGE